MMGWKLDMVMDKISQVASEMSEIGQSRDQIGIERRYNLWDTMWRFGRQTNVFADEALRSILFYSIYHYYYHQQP